MQKTDNKGFTLMEVLVVVAIIGVLTAVAIPAINTQFLDRAKYSVDLANMNTAYSLAQAEMITNYSNEMGPYYFNGSTLQSDPSGIVGYGQSTEHVSEFAGSLPVESTGTPNPSGTPEGANYLVVYCNENGVSRLSWGSGSFGGKQAITQAEHEAVAANHDEALALDVELLNSLEEAVRGMSAKEIRELIAKYKPEVGAGNRAFVIARCNVLPSHEVDTGKTVICVPEIMEAIGYDTKAENLYIIQSRDSESSKNGDVIWVNLGFDYTTAADDAHPTKAYTYVKSNGDTTDDVLREATRKNINNR